MSHPHLQPDPLYIYYRCTNPLCGRKVEHWEAKRLPESYICCPYCEGDLEDLE